VNSWRGRWSLRYFIATVAMALPIAILEMLRTSLSQTTIALLLVLPVILVAVTSGRGPALYASIVAGLSFHFFFIPPFYSFLLLPLKSPVGLVCFAGVRHHGLLVRETPSPPGKAGAADGGTAQGTGPRARRI